MTGLDEVFTFYTKNCLKALVVQNVLFRQPYVFKIFKYQIVKVFPLRSNWSTFLIWLLLCAFSICLWSISS